MNPMSGMPKMDLSGAQDVTCDKCNASTFDTVFVIKRMPGGVIPIPIFRCSQCKHINKEFQPSDDELKSARLAGFSG
jgi:hypothetical protein